MQLQIDESLKTRIPGVAFGTVTINRVYVRQHDEQLWSQIEALALRSTQKFSLEKLAAEKPVTSVRGLQKAFGFDPSRYRPSSEALLRRVLKGQGLHRINTAVDVNNLCSLEFLLPMCIYDMRAVKGQIRVRIGEPGESYPGIGRQIFQIEGKVIIADDEGVMGSTVSDSERTKVTTATEDIFLAIYAPADNDLSQLQQYAKLAGKRMVEFNGGEVSDVQALSV